MVIASKNSTHSTSMRGTRKRKRSEDDPVSIQAPCLPLTARNLALLEHQDVRRTPYSSPSPRRRQSPVKNSDPLGKGGSLRDEQLRLSAHGIEDVSSSVKSLPESLQQLVQRLSQRDSDHTIPPTSPRKDNILDLCEVAASKKEDDAIDVLLDDLFLHTPARKGDDDGIDLARNHNFCAGFLPDASKEARMLVGPLENSRPDFCFGYVRPDIAKRLGSRISLTPLTPLNELALRSKQFAITTDVLLPFLTVQFKAAITNNNIRAAEIQGLRDGCAVVRANLALLRPSYMGRENEQPPADVACHFSATTDFAHARLYVHYEDPVSSGAAVTSFGNGGVESTQYKTVMIYETPLRPDCEREVASWRSYMRGIYRWAVGPRLHAYRDALQLLAQAPVLGPALADDAPTSASSYIAASQAVSRTGASSVGGETGNNDAASLGTTGRLSQIPQLHPTPPLTVLSEAELGSAQKPRAGRSDQRSSKRTRTSEDG